MVAGIRLSGGILVKTSDSSLSDVGVAVEAKTENLGEVRLDWRAGRGDD